METTFISILDLSPEARIAYASDSVIDVLGYSASEVVGRSCWDFFHPEELPIARSRHGHGVEMDKAAVLSYCRMKTKTEEWIGCEVVFTVVYDCLVGCTSIYRTGTRSQNRALDAPVIRRLFSSSPRDPRYHMLSHLSTKFSIPHHLEAHEPRAALFLNRYTRTLTIMYATNGLQELLGVTGDEMRGKSFYYCIQPDYMRRAVTCLENAKANHSIAYLRFCWRDPRLGDSNTHIMSRFTRDDHQGSGETTSDGHIDGDANGLADGEDSNDDTTGHSTTSAASNAARGVNPSDSFPYHTINGRAASTTGSRSPQRRSSVPSIYANHAPSSSAHDSTDAIFSDPLTRERSSASSLSTPGHGQTGNRRTPDGSPERQIELEAVVSCTSDGLVVCLREAYPLIPQELRQNPATTVLPEGAFAVPWSSEPMMPEDSRPKIPSASMASAPFSTAQAQRGPPTSAAMTARNNYEIMDSIRDIAVFAWALTGINGSLVDYSNGRPQGDAQPASGLPVWQPDNEGERSRLMGATRPPHTRRDTPNVTRETSGSTMMDGIRPNPTSQTNETGPDRMDET